MKTDLAIVSKERLMKIERLINSRSRKRFGRKTPYKVFYAKDGCCNRLLNIACNVLLKYRVMV
jgi:hypothetical protein